MKGDYSRLSFNPAKRYRAVLMQQGRLQLDADWNEQVQIAEHRYGSFFRDMVGRSGTPRPMEMKLAWKSPSDSTDRRKILVLTQGVYYIDGLLIENESDEPPLNLPSGDGNYLYYLDAWTREVGAAEDDDLIDPAVGTETTTRLKTEWALRYEKFTPDENLRKEYLAGNWPELPSGDWWRSLGTGELTIVSDDPKATDITVKVKDNRLYRVEVHSPESKDFAFKWSSDNASVCAGVIVNEDGKTLKLKNNNVNTQNAFKGVAWLELCVQGETVRMIDMSQPGNKFENGILSLAGAAALPSGTLPGTAMTVRRWDGVFSGGSEKNSLQGELGVAVYSTGSAFCRTGDYWLILIRDGKIVNWMPGESRSPDGVEHHFAALALVNINSRAVAPGQETLTLTPLHMFFNSLTSPDLSTPGHVEIGGNVEIGGDLKVKGSASVTKDLTAGNAVIGMISAIDGRAARATIEKAISDSRWGLTVKGRGHTVINGKTIIRGALAVDGTKKTTIAGDTVIGTPERQKTLTVAGDVTAREFVPILDVPEILEFDSGIKDSKTFVISSINDWSVIDKPGWCTVSPSSGYSGNTTVTVSVTENIRTDPRSGTVTFRTTGGLYYKTLTVTQSKLSEPVISGFVPSTAGYGAVVTIFGANFHPTAGKNTVTFNGNVVAPVLAADATQLTVTVPITSTGKIKVTIVTTSTNLIATSGDDFIYKATVTHELTIARNPEIGGNVSGGGTYIEKTPFYINAAPTPGYKFNIWDITFNTANANLPDPNSQYTAVTFAGGVPPGKATIRATFALKSCKLTIATTTGGTATVVSPSSGGTYIANTAIPITAALNSGYRFVNWTVTSGAATIQNAASQQSATVTLTDHATIQANFALKSCKLTIERNLTAGGTVTTPASGSTHNANTAIPIKATLNSGYKFDNWTVKSGAAEIQNATSQQSATVTLTGDATIQANFSLKQFSLTVNRYPTSWGTVTINNNAVSSGTYDAGTAISITATPDSGCSFAMWTVKNGDATIGNAKSRSTTVTLSSNATIRATFLKNSDNYKGEVGKIYFKNTGVFTARVYVWYRDSSGKEIKSDQIGSSLVSNIGNPPTLEEDPGKYGVPNGSVIRVLSDIAGGYDTTANEFFIYKSDSNNTACYTHSGLAPSGTLKYDKIK